MNYSPLSVHCTSLCLDILMQHKFKPLNHYQIDDMRSDIYELIAERAATEKLPQFKHQRVIDNATCSVMAVLHQYCTVQDPVDTMWILQSVEVQISEAVGGNYHIIID
ncbi:hypothetical protein [Vibrio fluminensis]|uniref:hypothetical protein n=1 Tax=Vibrio fluminensis TaxID=2783614 RepID=UPI001887FCE3|nr:hypothetical protein [Vibrio fluminensis]